MIEIRKNIWKQIYQLIKEEIMFTFKTKVLPRCVIKEEAKFKNNFYRYFVTYYKDEWELWARITSGEWEGYRPNEYFLGSYCPITKEWKKPEGYYRYDWNVMKQAERLYQLVLKEGENVG